MEKNYIVGLVLAVSFLVAVNVRADVVQGSDVVNFFKDQGDYTGYVQISDWRFTQVTSTDSGKGYSEWTFEMEHANGTSAAALKATGFNGNGQVNSNVNAQVLPDGTAAISHNSANEGIMSFSMDFEGSGPFVDSFYFNLGPFSSWSAAAEFDITVDYWYDGGIQNVTYDKILVSDGSFIGFVLDEGAYLKSITFTSTGTGNNGYKIANMGFGPPSHSPEPATLVVLGLGLTGVGLAARRRNKG